jgi:hypothetical protein
VVEVKVKGGMGGRSLEQMGVRNLYQMVGGRFYVKCVVTR